ncbi:AAA family ATPase [Arthrobacter sp. 92]|jgi:MoxR-like ATPase|uniref:AAA family ATPase n=1 Tax=Arthrobacter sp. 92 TaxID=3418175 RepID=UPI003CFD262A
MSSTAHDGRATAHETGGPARRGAEADVQRLVPDVPSLMAALDNVDYLADVGLATALFLAVRLPQPILLEGEAGVGKTEAAKALARVLDTPLFRLQCYEGIDAGEALYEWNHQRQLLGIRLAEVRDAALNESDLFGPQYLLRRPLLQAIEHQGPRPGVLLLDEIDRADAEFEAFTFELLAESAVTIPELGTIRATHPPIVVLTSNRTRDLHDALTRRCLYHWIDYPGPQRIAEIVRRRVPASAGPLALEAASAITRLRSLDMAKPPGIAEAIDWVSALAVLGVSHLDTGTVEKTWGSILKNRDDLELVGARGAAWLVGGNHG